MTETEIENAIIEDPAAIGYPGAGIIRNVRFTGLSGRVDLMLLPEVGLHRIVLVEVKRASAPEAADKVVGQLLKYYAHSLLLGTRGVQRLREYALQNSDEATSTKRSTPKQMVQALNGQKPLALLKEGRRLKPPEIALYVALDGELRPQLKQIVTVLGSFHGLHIGAIQGGTKSGLRVLAGGDLTRRIPD